MFSPLRKKYKTGLGGIIVLLFISGFCFGQNNKIQAFVSHKKIYLQYTVTEGGHSMLYWAAVFHSPASKTAKLNHRGFSDKIQAGTSLMFPLGNFNFLRINSVVNSKPIYYHVAEGERMRTISHIFSVSKNSLQRWNNLTIPQVFAGQVMLVGWVKFDKPETTASDSLSKQSDLTTTNSGSTNYDTSLAAVAQEANLNTAYAQQFHEENKEKVLQEASGAAVFFLAPHLPQGVYYAFFNGAPKGTILSIFNPANKQVVYAKVIGTVPQISKYHNAVIGLSANAAKILKAPKSQRIFVKLKYGLEDNPH